MAGDKLPNSEINKRVEACYTLRYENNEPFKFKHWIEYCHKHYGDKSEQTYTTYWSKSKNLYDDSWKERLNKLLGPATDELTRLLADEDPKVRQRAIDQIVKYTGNDIQKIEADIKGDITVSFDAPN